MKAAVFIRYRGGDGFGHVGWAFDLSRASANAGSVENHSGHIFTPATQMGFWTGAFDDPVGEMRSRGYDDLKWIEVENADPLRAYRTVLWIKTEAYKALRRNCEDDAYDVLRAFGVTDLTTPSLIWFPKTWFRRFRGTLAHAVEYEWAKPDEAAAPHGLALETATPWRPTWRRPWHIDFHVLKLARLLRHVRARSGSGRRR